MRKTIQGIHTIQVIHTIQGIHARTCRSVGWNDTQVRSARGGCARAYVRARARTQVEMLTCLLWWRNESDRAFDSVSAFFAKVRMACE